MTRNPISILHWIVALVLLFAVVAFGQQPDEDSSKTYTMKGMLIHGNRVSIPYQTPVRSVDRRTLETLPVSTLANVVSTMGNAFVKDYGGPGGIKTYSQRGLGSEQSLVLVNGMRISSSQNGLADIGVFPVQTIERVELFQGGFSSLVGADAVGGAVNIITMPEKETPMRVSIGSSIGSYGQQSNSIRADELIEGYQFQQTFGIQRSRGDYPFSYSNGNILYPLKRQNADIVSRYGNLQASFPLSAADRLRLMIYGNDSHRGVPKEVVSPVPGSKARQADKQSIVQVFYSHLISQRLVAHLNTQFLQQYERYTDPDIVIAYIPLDTYFKNDELRLEPKLSWIEDTSLSIIGGGEFVRTRAEGSATGKKRTRSQYAAYITGMKSIDISQYGLSRAILKPSLRYDSYSTHGDVLSPGCAGELVFNPIATEVVGDLEPTIHASVSRNFRAPTFNELYWDGGGGKGNPDLHPERATNVDVGMNVKYEFLGIQSIRLNYYSISMTDRIVWVSAGSGSVMPVNIRSGLSSGLETSFRWSTVDEFISVNVNYSYGTTTKGEEEYPGDPTVHHQLRYVPRELFNATASIMKKTDIPAISEAGMVINQQFIGYRYTTEDNIDYLPGCQLTDLSLRIRSNLHNFSLRWNFQVHNMFDKEYQIMLGYPMPGRSYSCSLDLQIQ